MKKQKKNKKLLKIKIKKRTFTPKPMPATEWLTNTMAAAWAPDMFATQMSMSNNPVTLNARWFDT